jgi:hypothetical protein
MPKRHNKAAMIRALLGDKPVTTAKEMGRAVGRHRTV